MRKWIEDRRGHHNGRRLPRFPLWGAFLVLMNFSPGGLATAAPARELAGSPPPEAETQLWYGLVETPSLWLRIVVKAARDQGQWSGRLVSVDQSDQEIPLSEIQIADGVFTFACAALKASFSGTLDEAGTVAEGKFAQMGGLFPLKLTRVQTMPPREPKNVWTGLLVAGAQELELQFRVFDSPDGRPYVAFDSLSQGAKGMPAEISETPDEITITSPLVRGTFTGKFDSRHQEIVGTWQQNGQTFPLTLHEAPERDLAPPLRPQTPKPPFPYELRQVSFPGGQDGVTLAGTLTLPREKSGNRAGFPAVVLVSGSGPQDRDETISEHRPFAVIADDFTRHGLAVLRYDDRGIGQSTGDFAGGTTLDFAADAAAAVRFLQTVPGISAGKMGLVGHSEGGLIAPLVAADPANKVAFIVLLAGPGVSGEALIRSQTRLMAQAAGAGETTMEASRRINDITMATVKSLPLDVAGQDVESAIIAALHEQLPEDMRKAIFSGQEGASLADQLDPQVKASLGMATTPWYRYFIGYDPAPTLQKVTCPVLAINGEKDSQVACDLNLEAIRQAFTAVGKTNFQCRAFPGLNHLFQSCTTGALSEYNSIEETLAPEVLTAMRDWISGQTGE